MAKVVLKNLVKKYDKQETIKGIDLEIEDKEFLVLVGPSGCGKSTVLRMIAGLEDITKGEIFIGDRLVNNVHPKDRDIAMVFQSYALYPHMNVYDNMAFGLKMRKFHKQEIDQRVKKAAEILHISDYLKRKPKQLSGGQRQRVALGRAIVRNPHVFLMDEPLSNLDAKLRVQMRSELIKLHKELQTTFIYVTHDQVEAMTMGSRIVILNNGVIQQIDSPENIYNNPKNMFVANFIGSPPMNFIEGKVVNNTFMVEETILPIPEEMAKTIISNEYGDQPIILGIRPEHFKIEAANLPSIEANIKLIEMLGSEKLLHFDVNGTTLIAKVASDVEIKQNHIYRLFLEIDKTILFNPKTQDRIEVKH